MKELTEKLLIGFREKNHNIFVTGSQRSGTTIMSKIIADIARYNFVDEMSFKVDDELLFNWYVKNPRRKDVIQCPGILHRFVYYTSRDFLTKNDKIVFVVRDINEIQESMDRIGWNYHRWEYLKLENELRRCGIKYDLGLNHIAKIKRNFFENYIAKHHEECYMLDYNNSELRDHPLFIKSKDLRKKFTPKQIKP